MNNVYTVPLETDEEILDHIKNKGIEVEVLRLPTTSLTLDYLYRFSSPFNLSIEKQILKIVPDIKNYNQDTVMNMEKKLSDTLAFNFKLMMSKSGLTIHDDIPVKIVYMKLVPDTN